MLSPSWLRSDGARRTGARHRRRHTGAHRAARLREGLRAARDGRGRRGRRRRRGVARCSATRANITPAPSPTSSVPRATRSGARYAVAVANGTAALAVRAGRARRRLRRRGRRSRVHVHRDGERRRRGRARCRCSPRSTTPSGSIPPRSTTEITDRTAAIIAVHLENVGVRPRRRARGRRPPRRPGDRRHRAGVRRDVPRPRISARSARSARSRSSRRRTSPRARAASSSPTTRRSTCARRAIRTRAASSSRATRAARRRAHRVVRGREPAHGRAGRRGRGRAARPAARRSSPRCRDDEGADRRARRRRSTVSRGAGVPDPDGDGSSSITWFLPDAAIAKRFAAALRAEGVPCAQMYRGRPVYLNAAVLAPPHRVGQGRAVGVRGAPDRPHLRRGPVPAHRRRSSPAR